MIMAASTFMADKIRHQQHELMNSTVISWFTNNDERLSNLVRGQVQNYAPFQAGIVDSSKYDTCIVQANQTLDY